MMNKKVSKLIELCVTRDSAWGQLEQQLISEGMSIKDAEVFCNRLAASTSPESKINAVKCYNDWEKQKKPSNYFQMLSLLGI